MAEYKVHEILAAHTSHLAVRSRIERREFGWAALAQFFTDDATFVDPGIRDVR